MSPERPLLKSNPSLQDGESGMHCLLLQSSLGYADSNPPSLPTKKTAIFLRDAEAGDQLLGFGVQSKSSHVGP